MIPLVLLLLAASPLLEAGSALKEGNYEAAIRLYRFHLETEPSSYEALFGLARALAFSGQRSEAINVYTDMLSRYPDDADALLGRGRVYAWERQFDEAEKDLRILTEKFPKYADAWSALGDLYLWSARVDLALSAYTKWAELSPDEPGPYIARANAHRDARRFSLAREELFSARAKGGDRDEIDRILRELDRIPGALPWEASLSYGFESLSSRRPDSHTYTARFRRTFSSGSVALEAMRARRFSKWDEAIAFDGFLDLWRRSYGNLRFQAGPDNDVLPRIESTIEIFQGFGEGWELSGGYRYAHFSAESLDFYSVSLGKYIGDWFLRGHATFFSRRVGLSFLHGFFVRRYLETVDDFAEIGARAGREVVVASTGRGKETRKLYAFSFRAQKFLLSWLGISFLATYNDDDVVLGRGFSIGILTRW